MPRMSKKNIIYTDSRVLFLEGKCINYNSSPQDRLFSLLLNRKVYSNCWCTIVRQSVTPVILLRSQSLQPRQPWLWSNSFISRDMAVAPHVSVPLQVVSLRTNRFKQITPGPEVVFRLLGPWVGWILISFNLKAAGRSR